MGLPVLLLYYWISDRILETKSEVALHVRLPRVVGELEIESDQSFRLALLNFLNNAADASPDDVRLEAERESLGLYLSGHPFDQYRNDCPFVSSGTIAALLARGVEAFEAACAGVLAHARAGRVAAARVGVSSVIATDVIAALPAGLDASGELGGGEHA